MLASLKVELSLMWLLLKPGPRLTYDSAIPNREQRLRVKYYSSDPLITGCGWLCGAESIDRRSNAMLEWLPSMSRHAASQPQSTTNWERRRSAARQTETSRRRSALLSWMDWELLVTERTPHMSTLFLTTFRCAALCLPDCLRHCRGVPPWAPPCYATPGRAHGGTPLVTPPGAPTEGRPYRRV